MPFVPAIQACLEIIEKYYGRTEYTDVYIMAMGKSLPEPFFFILVMHFTASTRSTNEDDVDRQRMGTRTTKRSTRIGAK